MAQITKFYKGIPLAFCPADREMTDQEILKAMADGFKMLQADGWKSDEPPDKEGEGWKK